MSKILIVSEIEVSQLGANITIHIAFMLQKMGYRVLIIDANQQHRYLADYLHNRKSNIRRNDVNILDSNEDIIIDADEMLLTEAGLEEKFEQLKKSFHVIIIYNTAYQCKMRKLFYSFADDVHSLIKSNQIEALGFNKDEKLLPGFLSEFMWQQKKIKAAKSNSAFNWFVALHDYSDAAIYSKHKLKNMSKKFGFKILPGFTDHCNQSECFQSGLTVFDLPNVQLSLERSLSLIIAKQEFRRFFQAYRNFSVLNST